MSEMMSANPAERRAERRVRVRLPLRVQGVDRTGAKFAEHTTSEDLCRGGVAFSLVHEIDVDVELDLSMPLPRQGPRGETDFSTTGRVRHVKASGAGHVVGVQFIGPRFRHLFASESPQE
jgi:hypothetical protein